MPHIVTAHRRRITLTSATCGKESLKGQNKWDTLTVLTPLHTSKYHPLIRCSEVELFAQVSCCVKCCFVSLSEPSVIMWLHFECSMLYMSSDLPFLISNIWALWCSGLSAKVPKCQKLKMVGQTCMAKCNNLKSWALKGIICCRPKMTVR